jgi:hypothetical protein
MNCYFCLNGIDHNNNHNNNELLALKGASSTTTTITSKTPKSIALSSTEADLIRNVINIAGFYVTRNPQVFQQPEEMIRKLTEAFYILSPTTTTNKENNNNSVKGASICPTKKEHFKELLNMFHL